MSISATILAGGRATRMGGVDKGLLTLQEKPLIQHVIDRLSPQVDEILINANREIAHYQAMGYPVLNDETADFPGPLAGIHLGLTHAKHDYLLSVPCDSPLLPLDLAMRLLQNLHAHHADIAVATSDGNAHPVFCLCKKNVLPSLTAYLQQGQRKVSTWQKSLPYIEVDFSQSATQNTIQNTTQNNIDAFINLNTFDALAALEHHLSLNHE